MFIGYGKYLRHGLEKLLAISTKHKDTYFTRYGDEEVRPIENSQGNACQ